MSLSNCPKTLIKRKSYEELEKKTHHVQKRKEKQISHQKIMQSKKQCSNILIILKENSGQPRIYTQKKISFTNTTKRSVKTPSLSSLSLLFPLLFLRLCQFACENNYLDISLSAFTQQCTTQKNFQSNHPSEHWVDTQFLFA